MRFLRSVLPVAATTMVVGGSAIAVSVLVGTCISTATWSDQVRSVSFMYLFGYSPRQLGRVGRRSGAGVAGCETAVRRYVLHRSGRSPHRPPLSPAASVAARLDAWAAAVPRSRGSVGSAAWAGRLRPDRAEQLGGS